MRDRLGVRRDRHGPDDGAGQPRQHHFRAVFGMDEHMIADTDAPAGQPGGDATHIVVELRVGPLAAISVPGGPDQGRVVTSLRRSIGQKPGDVLPVHVELFELRRAQRRTLALPRYFGVALHALTLRGQCDLLLLSRTASQHQPGELVHRSKPTVEIPLPRCGHDMLDPCFAKGGVLLTYAAGIHPLRIPSGPERNWEVGRRVIPTKARDDRTRSLRRETHGLEAVTPRRGAPVGRLAAPADPDRDRAAGLREESHVVERREAPVKAEGVLHPRSPEQIDRLVEALAAVESRTRVPRIRARTSPRRRRPSGGRPRGGRDWPVHSPTRADCASARRGHSSPARCARLPRRPT